MECCSDRLNPSQLFIGVITLLFASGAGAQSRSDIGLVISVGMSVGTLFTLFVVPMIYTYLAVDHRPDAHTQPAGNEV